LILTADYKGDVRLWDLRPLQGGAGRVFQHPAPVWDATLNASGDKLLTGCAGSLDAPGAARVWELPDGPEILLEHKADVMVARFRPGQPHEVVSCANNGTVLFWDTRTRKPVGPPLTYDGKVVYTAAFDSTGNRFAYAGEGGVIRVWDW